MRCLHCSHCSSIIRATEIEVTRDALVFCCMGCKTAYLLIQSLHLEAHYKFCNDIFNISLSKVNVFTNNVDYMPFIDSTNSENNIQLIIEGIRCGSCVWLIENTLREQDGILQASVNMTTKVMSLIWTGDAKQINYFVSLIEKLGYKALPIVEDAVTNQQNDQAKHLLKAIAVSGFVWVQNMMISMGIWAGNITEEIAVNSRLFMNMCAAAVTIPGVIYSGQTFFRSAVKAVRSWKSHMDIPISIAIILTLLVSIYATFTNSTFVYYEAASSLVFALLIGRYLDMKIRNKAAEYARNLVLQKTHFITLCKDDELQIVSVKKAAVGDIAYVASGERIPLDGCIIDGESEVDNSIITGESKPNKVKIGDKVFAGAVNINTPLKIRVDSTVNNTVLSEIKKLIEKAEQNRSKYKTLADKSAQIYTPVVLVLTLLTFIGWFVHSDFSDALLYGISVLVITCPCAMGLAIPIVQITAVSNLMKRGIFIKSDTALERLSEVKSIAFDKTGVLTYGRPILLNADTLSKWAKFLIKGLAVHSKHHLCNAIVKMFNSDEYAVLDDVYEEKGIGIAGIWEYKAIHHVEDNIDTEILNAIKHKKLRVSLGRKKFGDDIELLDKNNSNDSIEMQHILHTWFLVEGVDEYTKSYSTILEVKMLFADKIREEVVDVISNMTTNYHISKDNICIISGDSNVNVEMIANICNIKEWHGELTPQGKYDVITQKQSNGEIIMMVGDGLNDAAAMKAAHISISPSSVMELSQNQADIVFQHGLNSIVQSISIAKKSVSVSKQNIYIAILYNIVSIPVAMLGFASPLVAAIFMSLSSLFVVANTLLQMYIRR